MQNIALYGYRNLTSTAQAALTKSNTGTYGRIKVTDGNKTVKLPALTKRELGYFDLLKTLLGDKKFTFVFDLDQTILTFDGKYSPEQDRKIALSGFAAITEYRLKHAYPTSIGHAELFDTLSKLEQNLGFVTASTIDAFVRLKMSRINLDDIDFVSFVEPAVPQDSFPTRMYREYFEIEDQVNSLNDLLKAIEEKHGIKINAYPYGANKRYAQSQLYANGSDAIKQMLDKSIVAIGDGYEDPYLAYPYHDLEQIFNEPEYTYGPGKGGIGIQLLHRSPKDSDSTAVYSLGCAVCYAASLVTNDKRGEEHVDEMVRKCKTRQEALKKEDEVVGNMHLITTHSNQRDVNKTWEELLKQGPIPQ